MVEELLEFSKMEDGRFTLRVEQVDLQAEFEDAIFTYRELFRQEGIELDYDADSEIMGETRIGQGRDAAKQYLKEHPEEADKLEADIRKNFDKLMSSQAKAAAKAAGRAVDVSADDFEG